MSCTMRLLSRYVDDRYGKMQVRIAGIEPQLEFSTYDAIADATQLFCFLLGALRFVKTVFSACAGS